MRREEVSLAQVRPNEVEGQAFSSPMTCPSLHQLLIIRIVCIVKISQPSCLSKDQFKDWNLVPDKKGKHEEHFPSIKQSNKTKNDKDI